MEPWITPLAIAGGCVATLLYYRKREKDKRRRKDEESRKNKRNALKRMYEELNDTFDAIERERGIHTRYCGDCEPISFLKMKFSCEVCEDLIKTPEIIGANIDMMKIVDVINFTKENNRIFDWMERDLPLVDDDHDTPVIEDDAKMLDGYKKMYRYQKQLREKIPPMLKKIKKECNQLS